MGTPMALNVVRARKDLTVWNRSSPSIERLVAAGATAAPSVQDVFASCDVVLTMLANGDVADELLGREGNRLGVDVAGTLLVPMGTTPPEYSRDLAVAVRSSGGTYAEAPVSGSRLPAEQGQLIAMIAGDRLDEVAEVVAPMCAGIVRCGDVPSALSMKLAVNLYLITTVTGLAEATHFAAAQGLDLETFRSVLDAGPMSSAVSRTKLEKMVSRDFDVQAAISDVLYNNQVIAAAARRTGVATPLLDESHRLFDLAQERGFGGDDMAGILQALEARTDALER